MELTFERYEDGRWYVVLPEYEGDHEDLEMVENSDKMLDALTTDGMYATLDVSLEEPADGDYFSMEMESHDDFGAFYNVEGCPLFSGTIWLCNVVHSVFREHPDTLYCKVID